MKLNTKDVAYRIAPAARVCDSIHMIEIVALAHFPNLLSMYS